MDVLSRLVDRCTTTYVVSRCMVGHVWSRSDLLRTLCDTHPLTSLFRYGRPLVGHELQSDVASTYPPLNSLAHPTFLYVLSPPLAMRQQSLGDCGKRNNTWQRFQQQQQQVYGSGVQVPLNNRSQSSYHRPQSVGYEPSRAASLASSTQHEVVAFIEAFRAHQSSRRAPPNALTVNVVVQAICTHFRTFVVW